MTWPLGDIGRMRRHALCRSPCGERPDTESGSAAVSGRDEGVMTGGDGHTAACVTIPKTVELHTL